MHRQRNHAGPSFTLALNDIMVTSIIVNHQYCHGDLVCDYHGNGNLVFRIIFLSTLVAGKTLVWRFNLSNQGKNFFLPVFFIAFVVYLTGTSASSIQVKIIAGTN